MSTHRKIEWALFILGVMGIGLSLWFGAATVQTFTFGLEALFAGLHAFKIYDGQKANHVVVITSLALVGYTGYLTITNLQNLMSEYAVTSGLIVGLLLTVLSLRLRQDFHRA